MRLVGIVVGLVSASCGRIHFGDVSDAADSTLDGDALGCPASYSNVDGRCYRVDKMNLVTPDWHGFELLCEADAIGSHLLVIHDASELASVLAFLQSPSTSLINGAIGISSRSGQWLSVFGTPAYLAWAAGQPGASLCVGIDSVTSGMYTLPCTNFTADTDYICEYDGLLPDPASS